MSSKRSSFARCGSHFFAPGLNLHDQIAIDTIARIVNTKLLTWENKGDNSTIVVGSFKSLRVVVRTCLLFGDSTKRQRNAIQKPSSI